MDRLINNKQLATIIRISVSRIWNSRQIKVEGTKWGVQITCKKPNLDIEKMKEVFSKFNRVSSQKSGSVTVPINITDIDGKNYTV